MVPTLSVLIIFFTSFLLYHGIHSIPTLDYHFCSKQFTAKGSPYQANLNRVLNTLSYNPTFGFYQVSVTGDTPVYGQYLCRGDVTAKSCSDCVSYGVKDIVNRCPRDKKAYIWYDQCSLRYSDRKFFGFGEEDPQVFYYNYINISNPKKLAQFLATTMAGEMAFQAARDTSGKKFATKEVNFSPHETLYSLVQCTPDLSVGDCVRCIKTGVSNLRPGSKGGKEFLPSCIVRYETYPFYNLAAVPATFPTTSLPKVKLSMGEN